MQCSIFKGYKSCIIFIIIYFRRASSENQIIIIISLRETLKESKFKPQWDELKSYESVKISHKKITYSLNLNYSKMTSFVEIFPWPRSGPDREAEISDETQGSNLAARSLIQRNWE